MSVYICTLYEHVPKVCCSDSGLVAVVGCSSEVPVACVAVCGVDDGCACEAGDGTVDTSGSGSWSLPEERREQTA